MNTYGAPTLDGGMWLGFVVDSAGVAEPLIVSATLSAGYDILTDDGYPAEKAAELLVIAERTGRDPEAVARKMVELRRGLRDAQAN